MSDRLNGPRARISLPALQHNLQVVRQYAPRSRVLAVIKANAYGHGMIAVAKALQEADAFAVARIDEALSLRAAGVHKSILLLEGVLRSEDLALAAQHRLELVVHSPEQLAMLEAWRGEHRFSIWLKIDTGMHRLGFGAQEFASIWERIRRCHSIAPDVRVMTHLACADEPNNSQTARQLMNFRQLTGDIGAERSAANSAALIDYPDAQFDWVRPGLMLYGMSPFADRDAARFGLRAAMTLETSLIAVHDLAANEPVGYGARWRAARATRIGIAAIGYGDGYPRHAKSGTPVLVGNERAVIAGRVSMDMIAIDLSTAPSAAVGANVRLWGEGLPAEIVAPHADTIPYELVCAISQRVKVEYV